MEGTWLVGRVEMQERILSAGETTCMYAGRAHIAALS
jgi:hypothetical protein